MHRGVGDIVHLLALSIYLRTNVSNKVVACFAETCNSRRSSYIQIIARLCRNASCGRIQRTAPNLWRSLRTMRTDPLSTLNIVGIMPQNMIQCRDFFPPNALEDNNPERAHLQTCLLETNLAHAPQVADTILGSEMFACCGRPQIANLCKKAGLLQ
jgi:clathrin heavy chain